MFYCIVRVKRSFVSFACFVRLRLVRIVNQYDPGSVKVNTWSLMMCISESCFGVICYIVEI